MRLFTYGTLMFPEVWERIALPCYPSQPAKLPGYAIFRVLDAVYPGIVRSEATSFVNGVVYEGLDEEALLELDTYESRFYERQTVNVTLEDGEQCSCQAYVVPEQRRERLSAEAWDPQWFRTHELQRYLHG